jgi:hypothetical protein
MKRIISFIFVILFFWSTPSFAQEWASINDLLPKEWKKIVEPTEAQAIPIPIMGASVGGGAAPAYTDITLWLAFEGTYSAPTYTLNGDDYSSQATGTMTSAGAIDATGGIIGTNGLRNTSSGDYLTIGSLTSSDINLDASRIGFWLRIDTWTAAMADGHSIMRIYGDINNAINVQIVGSSASDIEIKIYFRSGSTYDVSATTTALNMVEDTSYFIEVIMDQPNGLTLKVDGNNSEIVNDTYDAVGTNTTSAIIGYNAAAGGLMHVDNVMVSNDVTRNLYLLRNEITSPR